MFNTRTQAVNAVASLIVTREPGLVSLVNGLLGAFGYTGVEAPAAAKATPTTPVNDKTVKVQSSNLASVSYQISRRYDARRPNLARKPSILTVTFHNGSVYNYFGVQEKVYNDLLDARSQGEFFNENIRDEYKYTKVKAANSSVRSA